jgi:hypothetical protein
MTLAIDVSMYCKDTPRYACIGIDKRFNVSDHEFVLVASKSTNPKGQQFLISLCRLTDKSCCDFLIALVQTSIGQPTLLK